MTPTDHDPVAPTDHDLAVPADHDPTAPADRGRASAAHLESYGLELAFLVVLFNVMLLTAGNGRWWNLVLIAVGVRFGIAMAVRRYRLPADRPG